METKRRRIASVAATVAVLAVVATACSTSSSPKSSGSSPSSGAGGGTTTAKLSASAKGVTADTIKVAFTYPDLDALAKSGIVKVSHGSYPDAIKALVDDINASGGINGRKLDVVPEKFSVLGTADMLAVCTKATEDEQVFMVLGGFTDNSANECVVQQHSTPLMSSFGSGFNSIELAKAKAPWTTPQASDDRAIKALVQTLETQGSLAGKTIGIYGGGATSKPLVDLTQSTLKRAGFSVKDTAINDAPTGDTQAVNSQDKVIGSRFKDQGINVVIVLFTIPPGTNWDAVDFHPAMYTPQSGILAAGAFTNPYAKFPFVGGLGASADPLQGYNSPAMTRCRALWTKSTGKVIKTPIQEQKDGKSSSFTAMSTSCTALDIFVAAAKAAGANLTPETWLKGLESLGSIEVAGGNATSFGPNKPDGQDSFQLQKFNDAWKPGSDVQQLLPVGQPITVTS